METCATGLLLLLALLFLPTRGTAATTRTVTSLNDSGAGSLRQTIIDSAGGDTIDFSVPGTITLTSGELLLGRNLTITGPGAASLTVSGNNASRVFNISAGIAVNISNLAISHGRAFGVLGMPPFNCHLGGVAAGDGQGGGILNHGTLNLNNCSLIHNSAVGGLGGTRVVQSACSVDPGWSGGAGIGGGIANQGTLNMTGCTLNSNSAAGGDAGYDQVNDQFGSGGSGSGGGIYNRSALTLVNCTLSGNSAIGGIGGRDFSGVDAHGGGVFDSGRGSYLNTIIANNTSIAGVGRGFNLPPQPGVAFGPDVDGPVSSQGHNLIGRSDGSSGWITNDQTGTIAAQLDAQLGPLRNNGGPTPTMALLPISAAIDAGDDAVLGPPYNLSTDQRGGARRAGDHVDIGAYEFGGATRLVTTLNDSGGGSLRDAIAIANSVDRIIFAPVVRGKIRLTSGEVLMNKPLSIVGPGAAQLSISGNTNSRVFHLGPLGDVDLYGLTITEGRVVGIHGVNGDDVSPNEASLAAREKPREVAES